MCRYVNKDESRFFIIDKEDLDKILDVGRNWRNMSSDTSRIGIRVDNKSYYVDDIVMDKPNDKDMVVDHINKIVCDNRKENLRIIPKSVQNKLVERRLSLEPYDIDEKEVTRGIYFDRKKECFFIKVIIGGEEHVKYCTSDKKLTVKQRLEVAKSALQDIINENDSAENKIFVENLKENYSDEAIDLMNEYNDILVLSGYKSVKKYLVEIPQKKVLKIDAKQVSKKKIDTIKNKGYRRRVYTNLPEDCGITPDMLPSYCSYRPESSDRGDCFIIKRHPKLPQGKDWYTTCKKNVSTKEKFDELTAYYKTL